MDTPTYLLTVEPGGICIFDREPTNSQHSHPYWEICLVLRGTGEYIESGATYPVGPGVLFASPPNVVHEIRSPKTRDLELFFVSFTTKGSPGGMGDEDDLVVEAFLRGHEVLLPDMASLRPFVDLILGTASQGMQNKLARLFALEAMDRLRTGPKSTTERVAVSPEIRRALEFIDSQCDRSLTIGEVADHVSLSARSIHRRFVTQLGHSVAKEIRRRKMRRAAHLLLMGYSVQEVAHTVGIEDPSQFSAAFLAEIGSRPKKFQQTYLPGNLR
ncbi:MAG: helix-turn-helix transcriptional regulator [Armatimonadetes bacterium]|nr:helix-turn-helix transcriptional regulator [Armatimonadota bacterium]